MRRFRPKSIVRDCAIVFSFIGLAGCGDQELPVHPSPTVTTSAVTTTEADCANCVVGPIILTRSAGAPTQHSVSVAGDPARDYVVHLTNLTGKGAAVDVMLDGVLIAEFRTESGPTAEYPVQLDAENAFTFRVVGKPGSRIEVRVIGSEPPPPLMTVFEGPIVGATPADVEAACKATPLPTVHDSYYAIQQLDRLIVSRVFDAPWPGRKNGDVHAQQTATEGKLRFSCTQRNRDGSTASQFVVELGENAAPEITLDVKVCEANGQGGSTPTAINTGQVACPYAFGNIFHANVDFFTAGPFPTVEVVEGPTCTIFRPTVLGEGGRKHPILLWANGINLTPAFYSGLLTHFASHGFVVAAAPQSMPGTAGDGQNVLACLAYMEGQNATPGVYFNKLNVYRVGVAGHSAGGAGVIMAGRDPRITATAPVQPWVGFTHGYDPASRSQQNGPMFLSSGDLDQEIPFAHPLSVYTNANQPIFWGHRLESAHNDPLWDAPMYRRPLTAWFRFHLMLDASAAPLFYGANCQLCTSNLWVVQRKNGIQ